MRDDCPECRPRPWLTAAEWLLALNLALAAVLLRVLIWAWLEG